MKRMYVILTVIMAMMFAFCGCAGDDVWEVQSVNSKSSRQSIVEKNKMLWSNSDSENNTSAAKSYVSSNNAANSSKNNYASSKHLVSSANISSKVSNNIATKSIGSLNSSTGGSAGSSGSSVSRSYSSGSKNQTTSKNTVSKLKTYSGSKNTNGNMVWIPQSGSKYHSRAGCSKMKSPTKVTKEKAESMGYTPCKRCY